MILCKCRTPIKNVPPFDWQCYTCGRPIVEIEFVRPAAPTEAPAPEPGEYSGIGNEEGKWTQEVIKSMSKRAAPAPPKCPFCERSGRVKNSTQTEWSHFCEWCGRYFSVAAPQAESAGKLEPETDLDQLLAICEQNGTKWAHFKVSEIAKLRAELEQARMTLDLVATDELFVQPAEGGGWVFWLNVNDMFYPASDGEGIDSSEIPAVWNAWKERGWPAVVRWVQEKRGGLKLRKSREEKILSIEGLQTQLAAAESSVTRLTREREALIPAVQSLLEWMPKYSIGSSGYLRVERVRAALVPANAEKEK